MKRLYRSRTNKVFAGICGGVGEYMDIDPVIIRIITVVLTLFTGIPLLIYLVAVFVIPQTPAAGVVEQEGAPAAQQEASSSVVEGGPNMREHVRILGILYIAFSSLGLVAAFIVFAAVTGGGLISGDESAIAITALVGSIVAGILILVSAPGIIGGIGLLKYQNWARILVMVLGVINLLNIPFGTALGIYTIWALTNKDTEALFTGAQ